MEKVEVVLGNIVNTPGSEEYIAKQQRWLLFLRHCAKCTAQQEECRYGQPCTVAKTLWRHILECANPQCPYPRCLRSRDLLKHHQRCNSNNCPLCTPVKQYIHQQRLEYQEYLRSQTQLSQMIQATVRKCSYLRCIVAVSCKSDLLRPQNVCKKKHALSALNYFEVTEQLHVQASAAA